MTSNEPVISVRDLVVGFGDAQRARSRDARRLPRRDSRLRRRLRRRQVGADAHDHRALAQAPRHDRSVRDRSCRLERARAPCDRAALGRAVPAGRAVLLAHRAAEYRVSDPRISERPVAAPDRGDRARQAGNGRTQRRRAQKISGGAVRRHDQARRRSPARWRSIPTSFFSTSRLRASTRSAPPNSTS